ncbi:MFS general substrate transporter [Epithele typhae]|uniref:MFS general substrate transporter n=1 Tax=Epithele typhae TaxID=378194 RepID=UPI0020072564|nr:MFS general substrate transporter [Epithele typhae]KAH9915278.1 MFS general substrate transporter [Epithele typhae]
MARNLAHSRAQKPYPSSYRSSLSKATSDGSASDSDSIKSKLGAAISVSNIPPLGEPIENLGRLRYFWGRQKHELDRIATQPSVFDDPASLEVYRPPAVWENAHRFDPLARWTWREETLTRVASQRIVRKIDLLIMVNIDSCLPDLGLTTNDFNLGNTLFKLCFLIAELPSQLISKRVGPDVWIPSQMVLWSFVCVGQFWLSGRGSFLATRCLLGFLQGGFIPDVILYLSYFYTKRELQLRGVNGKAGWRYLFLIESGFTLLVGFASFFMMPPSPTQTKAWLRPNGWFTEREETIIVNRVLRDDPSKSDMHNRQGLSVKNLWNVIKDWRMWPIYTLGLTFLVPVTPPQTCLTLSLRNLGFTTTQSNLLSVPSKVFGVLLLLASCYLSEIIDSRVAATVLLHAQTSQWAYFAVVSLVTGFPYRFWTHAMYLHFVFYVPFEQPTHTLCYDYALRTARRSSCSPTTLLRAGYVTSRPPTVTSTNSSGVGTRTVSASLYNMFVQAGGIIAANIYRDDDKPLYKRGNRALIGITVMNIVLYLFTYLFYRAISQRCDRIWNGWAKEQQQRCLDTTRDEGNARMNFRFAY